MSSELETLYPDLYKAIFIDRRNVLITGPGGCGKSYTIGLIKKEFSLRNIRCDVTSTTGVSAHSIGGTTIHRFGSIKLGDKPLSNIINYIKSSPDRVNRWKQCDVLVIDEVSMLGGNTLSLLSEVAQLIRYGKRGIRSFVKSNNKVPPFGGIQIIFSADFMQLLPVNDVLAFKSNVWTDLDLYKYRLETPYRYPDINHFNLLSRVRVGEFTKDDIEALRSRVKAYEEYKFNEFNNKLKCNIKPTRIYPLKRDVDSINMSELEKLDGDSICYEADDTIIIKTTKEGKPMISPSELNEIEYMEYMDSIIPREIILKPGCQVMLTKNLSVEDGLVNGSRGVVDECTDTGVIVRFKCGIVCNISPEQYEYEDDNVNVIRHQFPLVLAWSMTIHKSQGSTLDYAIIDLGTSLFAENMGYVALSRCKTLDGIFIVNLIPERIRPNKESLEFEMSLRENK